MEAEQCILVLFKSFYPNCKRKNNFKTFKHLVNKLDTKWYILKLLETIFFI